jgi:hypothetical protein
MRFGILMLGGSKPLAMVFGFSVIVTPCGAAAAQIEPTEWVQSQKVSLGDYVVRIHGRNIPQADASIVHLEDRLIPTCTDRDSYRRLFKVFG